ncbi:MAG TPA: hypothetical protein VHU92_02415 [Streptosporangiaceae bacterium]|jgi:hypothetical protein|nr:hypothetical protein [Streptosporangiaceae bacterium]
MSTEQEIQLSDDLRRLADGEPYNPDLDAIERRGRGRRQRGLAIRGAAGLGVVALAAASLTLVGRSTPVRPHEATSGAVHTAPVQTAAYVAAHAESALARIDRYIVKDDERQTGQAPFTLWIDPRTGNTYLTQGHGAGRLAAWGSTYLVRRVMHWRTTQLNYGPRTWWTSVIHAAGPIQGAAPAGPYGGAGGTPAQIKSLLNSGHYRIIGHRVINGHRAIGLKGQWAAGFMEVWVDAHTYQPVHMIIADFAYKPGPLRHHETVVNESWMARSPSLVQLTNHPRIPAGFRHVPAPQ